MTSRQARTERRAAERKAKKAEMRRMKQAAIDFPNELANRDSALQNRECQRAVPVPGAIPPTPTLAERNRANAQHSTGPRTPAGKQASAANSLQHGLASGQILMPGEDPSAFESLLASLTAEHQPATPTEQLLVREMAQSHWLTHRALRLQNACFSDDCVDDKRLSLFLRYQSTHQRAFHKALATLMKMQKERARATKSGFVSQTAAHSMPAAGFASQNSPDPAAAPAENPPEDQFVRQNHCAEAA